MSATNNGSVSLSQSQARLLGARFKDAVKLPEPGESWLGCEIDLDGRTIEKFHKVGIIERREYESREKNRHFWETSQGVYEWVDARRDERTLTPCGNATGIRTITAGEEYTCTDDDCDCRMDRETAEAVIA